MPSGEILWQIAARLGTTSDALVGISGSDRISPARHVASAAATWLNNPGSAQAYAVPVEAVDRQCAISAVPVEPLSNVTLDIATANGLFRASISEVPHASQISEHVGTS